MSHVSGYDLAHLFCRLLTVSIISPVSTIRIPQYLFVCFMLGSRYFHHMLPSISIFQMPQVVEYHLFIESMFRFQTTQHSKPLSPRNSQNSFGQWFWNHVVNCGPNGTKIQITWPKKCFKKTCMAICCEERNLLCPAPLVNPLESKSNYSATSIT